MKLICKKVKTLSNEASENCYTIDIRVCLKTAQVKSLNKRGVSCATILGFHSIPGELRQ